MKHFFSLILFSFIVSLATISVAYSQILPERERATLRDEILKDRFDNLLPQLMDDTGIDMWLVVAREYNEDPVMRTMLPATWLNARRRTILVFYRNKEQNTLERLAVVELHLLHDGQIMLFRRLEARHDSPHRGHLKGVRRDVDAADAVRAVAEVLLVDLDLFGGLRDVGHVDLDGPVPQGLHELVALQLAVLRLVRVADDDLVDVGLRELLRLDLVLLGGAKKVVEEGHV